MTYAMGEGLARCKSYARRVQRGTQLEWGGRAMSSGLDSTRAIAVSERSVQPITGTGNRKSADAER